VTSHVDLLADGVERYLDAIMRGHRRDAIDVGLNLLDSGVPAETIISDLLAVAQVEVGSGWLRGAWSVAMEHRASAITESVLAAVADAAMRAPGSIREGSAGRAVISCTEGEWHLLPGRMAAEVLRLRGADVTFVGPSVPAADLAAMLGDDAPTAVGVTCSMPMSLGGAWRTITALRAIGMTVVCGGRGFGPNEQWCVALGADLWSPDLSLGADLLIAAIAAPAPPARGPAVDADTIEELRILERDHHGFVEAAVTIALNRWPFLIEADAAIRATREDLSSTLRTVESATITGDPTIVADYVSWFKTLLGARDLPTWYVAAAFELLEEVLPEELPRARRLNTAGLEACSSPSSGP
jgi:methanogenic corrinoid protein MtbC1